MTPEFIKQLETILNSVLSVLQVIATFLIAFLVVLWLTLCFWAFRDIQSRTRDIIAQIFSVLLVFFFNIPGVLLYILVRPKESLAQAYERSLQEEYILQDLEEREICPTCRVKTQPDYSFCYNCRTRLRRECPACNHLIKLKWSSCPFCGTPQKTRPRDTIANQTPTGLGSPRQSTQPVQQPAGALASNAAPPAVAPADGGTSSIYDEPTNDYLAQLTNRTTDNLARQNQNNITNSGQPRTAPATQYKPPRERRARPEEEEQV